MKTNEGAQTHNNMAANFEHPLADGPLGDRGWSASRKFASLMAAGDPFFVDSCNKERLAMDASLVHDTFEGQFAPAVAAQTCLFTAYVLRRLVAIARFEWLYRFNSAHLSCRNARWNACVSCPVWPLVLCNR